MYEKVVCVVLKIFRAVACERTSSLRGPSLCNEFE